MVSDLDVVNRGLWIVNTYHPTYNSWIGEQRCYPENPPHVCDCSGLMCAICRLLGISQGCISSAGFAVIGHQRGLGVSVEYAKTHPSYFLIRGPNQGMSGYGNQGHIGLSLGQRRSLEARGTIAGVGVFNADEIYWSYAMRIPGVTYNATSAPPAVKPSPTVREEQTVYWLPGQANNNFRPWGISCLNGTIFLWNCTSNPFKEGTIATWPNAHVLHLPLAAGEEIIGITDRRPDGSHCPNNAPIEVCTNLPGSAHGQGQPRHVLNRR